MTTRFKNLRRLSIHVPLGLTDHVKVSSIEELGLVSARSVGLVLTRSHAQSFAKRLFELRGPSALKIVTLKSGEELRWFPQWSPMWAGAEEEYGKIFEIYAPLDIDNDQLRINEMESSPLKREFARIMRKREEQWSRHTANLSRIPPINRIIPRIPLQVWRIPMGIRQMMRYIREVFLRLCN